MPVPKPIVLAILDGFGIRKARRANAIAQARMPNYLRFLEEWPHAELAAAGEAVGLPKGAIGNSEVGHLNIGAGRIVYQDLVRINNAINDGSFFRNPALLTAVTDAKRRSTALHIMGLLSDAGVHSHFSHLVALLRLAKRHGLREVWVHPFLDGRDVPPKSAGRYLARLERTMKTLRVGRIGTVMGRYYAMDRDKRWPRIERAYRALLGKAPCVPSAKAALAGSYNAKVTDEFVEPVAVGDFPGVRDGDAVVFFNFRTDRARQLTWAFVEPKFTHFRRERRRVRFVCMTEYDNRLRGRVPIAFEHTRMRNILGEVLAKRGLRQLRVAETEKYAHVTFFFNGGIETPFRNEDRILVPSPKVATYDTVPAMSAAGITDAVIKGVVSGKHEVIILNFANPDMVGHTGDFRATVRALEVIDRCLSDIAHAVLVRNGVLIITGDHGNAEQKHHPYTTSHTLNPVPFVLVGKRAKLRKKGLLADVAPTMLQLLGIPKPKEMTGKSLLS
jgi:2,3-bisphosphoglycerate-independent phosphoglycerate mutase